MKVLGIFMLLAVGSKAGINQLYFSGPNIYITCPGEGSFYHWKKYYMNQMTNLLSDDKKRLYIPLNESVSPITYECSGTNGFTNFNENITIFVLDQLSRKARKLCYLMKKATAEYPCFLKEENESVMRISKGSSVELDCETGGANVTYNWYKLNTPKSNQELMFKYKDVPVLKFVDVDYIMAGEYLCVVNGSSGSNLKRFFEVKILESDSTNNNMIVINGPEFTNVTVKMHKDQKLTCQAETLEIHKIHSIQWAKRIDGDTAVNDKTLTIKWADRLYKWIPEDQVQIIRPSKSTAITSLELKSVVEDTAGHYICVFFSDTGKVKFKSFQLRVEGNDLIEGAQRSFLFLYILIPALIIAICLFLGIYVTVNRRSVRKGSSSGTGTTTSNCCKSEEVMRLRTTPEYSMNSYPASAPPTTQYLLASNYQGSYYPPSDKMIL